MSRLGQVRLGRHCVKECRVLKTVVLRSKNTTSFAVSSYTFLMQAITLPCSSGRRYSRRGFPRLSGSLLSRILQRCRKPRSSSTGGRVNALFRSASARPAALLPPSPRSTVIQTTLLSRSNYTTRQTPSRSQETLCDHVHTRAIIICHLMNEKLQFIKKLLLSLANSLFSRQRIS